MAFSDEENADDGSVTEDADEEEETDESHEDDESGDEEEDAEDADDEKSDADDDAKLPKTRKELNEAIAKGVRDALKRSKDRSAADRRTSGKDRLPGKNRPGKSDQRIDSLEEFRQKSELAETKRQYGYENELSPEEVDLVFRFSKKPTAKTLRDPAIRGALEGFRSHKRAKNNIPGSSGRGGTKEAPVDYDKLPESERSKHFVGRRQALLEAKGGSRRR